LFVQREDSDGTVVKEDPVLYAFLWIGVIALTGLILAALLALALAAPAGILITRWFKREPTSDMTASANIEPE
jgi:hypothetical protein